MKRLFFTLSVLLMAFCGLNTNAKTTRKSIPPTLTNKLEINAGVKFIMCGVIGQGEGAVMIMKGTTGTFEYAGVKKKLVFKSYNTRTKQLILSEYNKKGQYVGKFVGKYIISHVYPFSSYIGNFTNVNGHTTEFALHEPSD